MPRQKTKLVNNEIYHVVSRAVGDSIVFKDENDYYRGIFSIYEFNNKNLVEIWERRRARNRFKTHQKFIEAVGSLTPHQLDERNKFVEILEFCFMTNHIHLLVRQLKDNGISQFMQKVGGGYANYFNKKYSRKGHLFSQFRAIHIKTNEQLQNVFVYIHVNPISLIESGWKENGIKNTKKVIDFLEKYKWSSYLDYIGKKNFPSVISKDFLLEVASGENECKDMVINWIKYKKEPNSFGDVGLE